MAMVVVLVVLALCLCAGAAIYFNLKRKRMNPDNNTQAPEVEFSNINKPETQTDAVLMQEPQVEVSDAGNNVNSPLSATETAAFGGPPPAVKKFVPVFDEEPELDGIQIDK